MQLLTEEKKYGYQLILELREKSGDIFCLKEGTLYPILYRLEDEGLVGECVTKNKKNVMTTSDKIDRIVTNRWLALPVFALVTFLAGGGFGMGTAAALFLVGGFCYLLFRPHREAGASKMGAEKYVRAAK